MSFRSLGLSASLLSAFALHAPTLHAGPHSFELLPTGEDSPHLFGKGVIFSGRAGIFYALQRLVAEAVLSLMILEERLRNKAQQAKVQKDRQV